MEDIEAKLYEENIEIDEAIGSIKEDIEQMKRNLENQKKEAFGQEQDINKLQGEIQRQKFQIK